MAPRAPHAHVNYLSSTDSTDPNGGSDSNGSGDGGNTLGLTGVVSSTQWQRVERPALTSLTAPSSRRVTGRAMVMESHRRAAPLETRLAAETLGTSKGRR